MEPFVDYLTARFADDPHVWASVLHDEIRRLGYSLSYPSFVRQLRAARLRPHCAACSGVKGRETIEIDHPAGEEIQWDWFERRHAPWGGTVYIPTDPRTAPSQRMAKGIRRSGSGRSGRGDLSRRESWTESQRAHRYS